MSTEFETVVINGIERPLGLLPTPPETKKLFATKRAVDIIPQKDWKPISSRAIFGRAKNQGNQGSCVGASGVKVMEMLIKREVNKDVELSIASLYGPINGGRDAGANLGDAFNQLTEVGCCLASTIGNYDWQTARRMSAAAKEECKSYRLDEGILCQSREEFLTWLQVGGIGQMGLNADNFYPDANGFVPGSNRGVNHALVACGMFCDSRGRWWVEGGNSWDVDWGPLLGMFYTPVDMLPDDELWIGRASIIAA